jgi:hypothetical protein
MDVHQHSIDLTVAESGHDGAVTHFARLAATWRPSMAPARGSAHIRSC